ncbi:uncharacterized protein LOC128962901 [Oppia nitens]|uniref:uncharacterized protein LOC128962901 n=1 Tax=Oppia nitens TaxID=1686743 RepID=UPI0023D9F386|nr:uncharacterized protein LOC128962901 [Oppia nitens]
MTVLVVGTVATVATCGAAAPLAAGAATGVGTTVVGTGAAAAGAAAATGTGAAAVVGGTGAAAAVSTVGAGGAVATGGLTTGAILSGPIGWAILGANIEQSNSGSVHHYYSYDCWKAIVRDTSAQPSSGKLLRDVLRDSRVLNYTFEYRQGGQGADNDDYVTGIKVENVWHDQFHINFLHVPGHGLAVHANKI